MVMGTGNMGTETYEEAVMSAVPKSTAATWTASDRSLRRRGLNGVERVPAAERLMSISSLFFRQDFLAHFAAHGRPKSVAV